MKYALVLALLVGCSDSNSAGPDAAGPDTEIPYQHLSKYGFFTGAPADQKPAAGVVPYDVNAVLYQDDAKKLRYLRGGRACVTFRSGWEWAAVEGPTRLIGPDDPAEGFDPAGVPKLLRDVFAAAGGTHDDWDEYDRVMAKERRVAVLVAPVRITGNG